MTAFKPTTPLVYTSEMAVHATLFCTAQCCTCLLSCVSVCVCLSVPALAASVSVGTSKQRYSRRLFLD